MSKKTFIYIQITVSLVAIFVIKTLENSLCIIATIIMDVTLKEAKWKN